MKTKSGYLPFKFTPMNLTQIALVVRDYDEAIHYYTTKLGFTLLENTPLSDTKRWVVVSPSAQNGCRILLAKAANEEQQSRIGNQTGGRVFLFLESRDFWDDYNRLTANNVIFTREPHREAWGTVAVFQDLYGNLWDLIGPVENK